MKGGVTFLRVLVDAAIGAHRIMGASGHGQTVVEKRSVGADSGAVDNVDHDGRQSGLRWPAFRKLLDAHPIHFMSGLLMPPLAGTLYPGSEQLQRQRIQPLYFLIGRTCE